MGSSEKLYVLRKGSLEAVKGKQRSQEGRKFGEMDIDSPSPPSPLQIVNIQTHWENYWFKGQGDSNLRAREASISFLSSETKGGILMWFLSLPQPTNLHPSPSQHSERRDNVSAPSSAPYDGKWAGKVWRQRLVDNIHLALSSWRDEHNRLSASPSSQSNKLPFQL